MKAVWFEAFGSAQDTLVTGEQPKPEVKAGEVLVRLVTTGVNPSDVKKRAGAFPNLLDDGLVIPHSDGAGVIEAVGEGVPESRIGNRVWVYQAQYGRRLGTAAEYVSIPDCRAPHLPDAASFEVGAGLGIPVMTAHRCVFAGDDIDGQTVLITGGAGRVGYYAIQWAKLAGARVIATASNPADRDTCLSVGAAAVCNHRQPGWGEAAVELNGGEKIGRVVEVEFGVNLPEVLKCVRIGATISTYSSSQMAQPQLPFLQMMFMDLTIRMVIVYAMPEQAKEQAIADIESALRNDTLRHRLAHVLPFGEMVRSHELVEQGGCGGCVVVSLG